MRASGPARRCPTSHSLPAGPGGPLLACAPSARMRPGLCGRIAVGSACRRAVRTALADTRSPPCRRPRSPGMRRRDGVVVGLVRLDDDLTGGGPASGASGDLAEQLKHPLTRAVVRDGEAHVCRDHADESHGREVQPLAIIWVPTNTRSLPERNLSSMSSYARGCLAASRSHGAPACPGTAPRRSRRCSVCPARSTAAGD